MTEPGSDLTEGQRWFLGARQRLCAPERDRAEAAEAERDVLQQRIDKALELSEYERDNLLALLKAVSGWAGPSVLSTANTGDWVMQVAGKLNPAGPEEGDWGRPNMSAEGIVRAVNERVAAIRCIKEETSDE